MRTRPLFSSSRRRPLAATIAGLLVAGAAACAPGGATDDGSVDLVAALYPLEFVADRVGGDHVAVTGLAPPGVEAHDLELSPSQVAGIDRADLVVYLAEFQPAVDDAVAEHAGGSSFDVAAAVPLLDPPGGAEEHQHEGEGDHADEQNEHEDDDHQHEDEGAADHEHGGADPHLWLDPDRLATVGTELAAQLGAVDSEHADEYTANAEALSEQLATLDTELADGLADCQRREIVVSHAAFGYLADRYDLRQIAVTGLSPETEPTPQQLAGVIEQAQEHQATTVFFEVLVDPAVADVIATEVGAQTAVLDPIEGLSPERDDDYFSLMRANLDTLRAALDCT